MTRAQTYGRLVWRPGHSLSAWVLDVRPHVAIVAKRLFPRVRTVRSSSIVIADTPQVSSELTWFQLRYPLEMDDATRARLAQRTDEYDAYMAAIDDVLSGRTTLDEFPAAARPARPYQQQAADLAYVTGGLLLGDDVGLGKTQSALMLLRDPTCLPALVVVPTHLPKQWLKELGNVFPDLVGHIITKGSPVVRRKRKGGVVEVPYDTQGADVLIINYAKLAGWQHHLVGRVKTVIFDEVQELRHSGTDKYTAAAAIADGADRRIGLSATPIHNYAGEVFNVYEVLKPGVLGTRTEFEREWARSMTPNGGVIVRDPAALGAFLRDQGLLLRRTRAEVGRELPAPTEIIMDIESDTAATDAIAKDADVLRMAEMVLYGSPTDRFVAAGQIDMRLREATGVDKAPYVAAFAQLLLESEQKIVLFGWHRAVYDRWLRDLAKFNPVMYTGSETAAHKHANVERFMSDPTCRIFICSLRSGLGLDGLHKVASVAVFGELDWSPAVHHQAIGRLTRDGQEGEVVAYYLLSAVGSDPQVRTILEVKRQQVEPLMAADDGAALFTAQSGDPERMKTLARSVLRKAGRRIAA